MLKLVRPQLIGWEIKETRLAPHYFGCLPELMEEGSYYILKCKAHERMGREDEM